MLVKRPLVMHTMYICTGVQGRHEVQLMACPHSEPTHYLNQCRLICNWTLTNKLQWNQAIKVFFRWICLWKCCHLPAKFMAGNAWVRTQHCCYWCPGAKAPGHQYLQCWENIHCIGLASHSNITVKGNNIKITSRKELSSWLSINSLRPSDAYMCQ